MSGKHTSGPWQIGEPHPQNACTYVIAGDGGGEVAALYSGGEGGKGNDGVWPAHPIRDANARLIAAAPEMLEALKWYARQMCEGFCADFPEAGTYAPEMDDQCAGCKARAAIAKAEGQS